MTVQRAQAGGYARDADGAAGYLTTNATPITVHKVPKMVMPVTASSKSNQAKKAVLGGTRYIKLVTAAAAPRWIIMYNKELAPKLKASTDQAKAPTNWGTH